MKLALIPQPKRVVLKAGNYSIRVAGTIAISDQELFPVAERARAIFRRHSVSVSLPRAADSLVVQVRKSLRAGGYRLAVSPAGVTLNADSAAAAFHGLLTLEQVVRQSRPGTIPCLRIEDWPDFRDRGVSYDVCRGRVPTREQLFHLADTLAQYKINHLQLYIEHTFLFRGHPDIGRGASPLTAEDILSLDRYCRERHVELVPCLASFGHLATVLKHPRYHHLAETKSHWSLSPANPGTYRFLDSLFSEFLPLFSSGRFNVCCDETWDLGEGQSAALCRRKGKGEVYLGHVVKLAEIARRYGKRIMFWGDIIRHYPALIRKIPRDVTVLDWGYAHDHKFETISDFQKAGLPFFACPGTSSWVSLFPRLPEAMANIHGFADAARRYGARGLLNTDWGDGGHYNFMEYSFHGYLFGAEQAWNTAADVNTFTDRFVRLFLSSDRKELAAALTELGDVSHLGIPGVYQSVWQHLFFAPAYDPLFRRTMPAMASQSRHGRIFQAPLRLNAELGRRTLGRLARIRPVFAVVRRGEDPHGVLPYWVFAVDTIAHAARKLTVLAPGGRDTPAARRALQKEMTALKKRFTRLWLARNRRSEIGITLARYDLAIRTMGQTRRPAPRLSHEPWRSHFVTDWQVSKVVRRHRSVAQASAVSLRDRMNWKAHVAGESSADLGFVNVHERYGDTDGLVYLANRIRVARNGRWIVRVGHDGGVKVFMDGKVVLCQPRRENPARRDRSHAKVNLTKGDHEFVVALDLDHGQGWGMFVAFEVPKNDRTRARRGQFPEAIR